MTEKLSPRLFAATVLHRLRRFFENPSIRETILNENVACLYILRVRKLQKNTEHPRRSGCKTNQKRVGSVQRLKMALRVLQVFVFTWFSNDIPCLRTNTCRVSIPPPPRVYTVAYRNKNTQTGRTKLQLQLLIQPYRPRLINESIARSIFGP